MPPAGGRPKLVPHSTNQRAQAQSDTSNAATDLSHQGIEAVTLAGNDILITADDRCRRIARRVDIGSRRHTQILINDQAAERIPCIRNQLSEWAGEHSYCPDRRRRGDDRAVGEMHLCARDLSDRSSQPNLDPQLCESGRDVRAGSGTELWTDFTGPIDGDDPCARGLRVRQLSLTPEPLRPAVERLDMSFFYRVARPRNMAPVSVAKCSLNGPSCGSKLIPIPGKVSLPTAGRKVRPYTGHQTEALQDDQQDALQGGFHTPYDGAVSAPVRSVLPMARGGAL